MRDLSDINNEMEYQEWEQDQEQQPYEEGLCLDGFDVPDERIELKMENNSLKREIAYLSRQLQQYKGEEKRKENELQREMRV